MGCDIHMHCEAKLKEDGRWSPIYKTVPGSCERFEDAYIYDRRNYRLFTWLAGVRDDGSVPTRFENRGMPSDPSWEVAKDYERWSGDAHSVSHLYLPELLAARPDDARVTLSGCIRLDVYRAFLESRKTNPDEYPNQWCGGTSAQTISEEQYNDLHGDVPEGCYIAAKWDVPLASIVGHLYEKIDAAAAFAKEHGIPQEHIRWVFWFDN